MASLSNHERHLTHFHLAVAPHRGMKTRNDVRMAAHTPSHGTEGIILECHPEPFGVAQDKLREGSKVPGNMVLTPLAVE